jgi:hypothetical protein
MNRIIARLALLTLTVALALAGPARAQVPDLAPWDGLWFKVKLKQNGYAFRVGVPGAERDKGAGTAYAQLHFDNASPEQLQIDVWVQEDAGWQERSFPLLYLAGAAADAMLYFNQVPVSPDPVVDAILHLGLVVRLKGKVDAGTVSKGTLKSIGGYFIEIDDVPGSDERFGGTMSLNGKQTTKLPSDLPPG